MNAQTAQSIGPFSAEDPRIKRVLHDIDKQGRRPTSLIQVLHTVQDTFGYVPPALLSLVSRELRVPPSRVYGVVTFYHYFALKPKGEHNCVVCLGTACYVKGAQKLLDRVHEAFGLMPGETTMDSALSVETARCLGACSLAPAVVLDDKVLAKVTPDGLVADLTAKVKP